MRILAGLYTIATYYIIIDRLISLVLPSLGEDSYIKLPSHIYI